ncbi:hypothetical protein N657DRAFT_642464 [Parathielavia appendiculata]|uniref:Uncharacterized protein n=1 Tax=Parathielavia appendiculata TaxID=2587402 RepID=A0AAN6Z583_9PEZI|nr:hypothetical protein N657DRAFT_642464 [Parathielavia appendiculata]
MLVLASAATVCHLPLLLPKTTSKPSAAAPRLVSRDEGAGLKGLGTLITVHPIRRRSVINSYKPSTRFPCLTPLTIAS